MENYLEIKGKVNNIQYYSNKSCISENMLNNIKRIILTNIKYNRIHFLIPIKINKI